jgi:formylglycine-generating enzyme required for sulfatase activity
MMNCITKTAIRNPLSVGAILLFTVLYSTASQAQPNPAGIDWQQVTHPTTGTFKMARTETTVAQFRQFASTKNFQTTAEKSGGGLIYESGWQRKPGWSWQAPYGKPANDDEPVAYVSYDEAQQFCQWAGAQLPTDAQWLVAAYTETRPAPLKPFESGKTYPFPTGDSPVGANCLEGCGARTESVVGDAKLSRGFGHAKVRTTLSGVNGLFDMGANLWEWVNEPIINDRAAEDAMRRTRGGSWWYTPTQMQASYVENKPGDLTVAYIGFRCARP